MNKPTLVAVALAALLVTAGVGAATYAEAPADAIPNDEQADERAHGAADREQATDRDAQDERDPRDEDSVGESAADREAQGPPAELPDQVPDHVSATHDLIGQFLDDDLEGSLGDAISDVTPGDDAEDDGDDLENDAEDEDAEDEDAEDEDAEDGAGDETESDDE